MNCHSNRSGARTSLYRSRLVSSNNRCTTANYSDSATSCAIISCNQSCGKTIATRSANELANRQQGKIEMKVVVRNITWLKISLLAYEVNRPPSVFLTRICNRTDNTPTIYTDISRVDNDLSDTGNEDGNDRPSESYPLFISASVRKYLITLSCCNNYHVSLLEWNRNTNIQPATLR